MATDLPRYEVTVNLQPYGLLTDTQLSGTVAARYTFDQPVNGTVEIQVTESLQHTTRIQQRNCNYQPPSVKTSFKITGEAKFSIPINDITTVFKLRNYLNLKVTAIVTEHTTGIRINGSSDITYHSEQYEVEFLDITPGVFKPGLRYTASVKVSTPDGRPPTDPNTHLSVYTRVMYKMTVPDNRLYDVDVFTGNYPLPPVNASLPADGIVHVDIDIPSNASSIGIKVVSKGSIQHSGTVNGNGQKEFTFLLQVTPSMAPTAHLLVYYIRGANDVIADSLAFVVGGAFNNKVSLSFSANQSQPRDEVQLTVTADPDSHVFVTAVDQSVLLLKSSNDVTTKQIHSELSTALKEAAPSSPEFALSESTIHTAEMFQVSVTLKSCPNFKLVKFTDNRSEYLEADFTVTTIQVGSNQQGVTYFPILASVAGALDLDVSAKSSMAADAVRGQVNVKLEGAPITVNQPVYISLNSTVPVFKSLNITFPTTVVAGSKKTRATFTVSQVSQMNIGTFTGESDEHWHFHRLTALVSRLLHESRDFMQVPETYLQGAVSWLVDRQNEDGSFKEFSTVQDEAIQGSGPVLTSHVLLSFVENTEWALDQQLTENAKLLTQATLKARTYLEKTVEMDVLVDPYTLAVVSYALAMSNSSASTLALNKLLTYAKREGGLLYWRADSSDEEQQEHPPRWRPVHKQARSADVIITSYAVLTFVALGRLEEAVPAVTWLTSQRNPQGGFVSTQDTTVGLQALSEFATLSLRPDTSVSVTVDDTQSIRRFNITRDNALTLQTQELNDSPSNVMIKATGTGIALVEVSNSFHVEEELTSPSFDVTVVLLEDELDRIKMMVCTKLLSQRSAGLVVQEVGIPSGFQPDLTAVDNVAGLVKTEVKGNFLNVYLDEISVSSVCYTLKMFREAKVARSQKYYVKTYDYYEPVNQATVFYHPKAIRESKICDVCPGCCP
ncbi:CD109 antigen-like [Physella acuta]|uniref:CD109 antigen-like n=1 Tax=Physella acuta TaxID=109671 RepID=UPI0027DD5A5D|nr:CD109 antigen-like [Physella acuta]